MKKVVVTTYSTIQAIFAVERYAKEGYKLVRSNDGFPQLFGGECRLTFIPDENTSTDAFHHQYLVAQYNGDAKESEVFIDEMEAVKKRMMGRPKGS